MLASKTLVMGFGHRIYKNGDPRNAIFKKMSKALSERPGGNPVVWQVSDHIEAMMANEKKMYPNADFFAASAYHQAGVPTPFFYPVIRDVRNCWLVCACDRATWWKWREQDNQTF